MNHVSERSCFLSYYKLIFSIGLQVAFSPSFSSLVQIRNDGKVKWKPLEYHIADIGSSMEDRQYPLLAPSALCLQSRSTICSYHCSISFIMLHRSYDECQS